MWSIFFTWKCPVHNYNILVDTFIPGNAHPFDASGLLIHFISSDIVCYRSLPFWKDSEKCLTSVNYCWMSHKQIAVAFSLIPLFICLIFQLYELHILKLRNRLLLHCMLYFFFYKLLKIARYKMHIIKHNDIINFIY